MKWAYRLLAAGFWLLLPVALFGQSSRFTDTLRIFKTNQSYKLSHPFILQGSESARTEAFRLTTLKDYTIDYGRGTIRFVDRPDIFFPDSLGSVVVVSYEALAFEFKREYSLRRPILRSDTSAPGRPIIIASPSTPLLDDVFGDELQKSGSLVRGFTFGSNRDLSLTSGFRLQFAGKLSPEIDINAALTDENSPLQPEGTTQTLQEVDKVFIEMKSPSVGATLGDFSLHIGREDGGEFGRITRKVQGAQGTAVSRDILSSGISGKVSLTGAIGRGKFHTLTFQGREGNQGPYRLVGKNGERQIIVIGGSERVFVDGQAMTRGEVNDYTIDYASAEVTFSSRRLMTSASRITVDFEYSDRQFERNLVNAAAGLGLLNDRVTIRTVFTQEADNSDSPLDFSFDDNTREIVRQSGRNRLQASVYGAAFVGRDSLTSAPLGQYIRRDTVIAGRNYSVFLFAPGDSNALYSVSFSPVQEMPPDSIGYVKKALGEFHLAGLGQGNFLPLKFLPVPELVRTVDVNAAAAITPDLSLAGEFAASEYDRNRLSSLDNAAMNGYAHSLSLKFAPKSMTIGTMSFGDLDLQLSERTVNKDFVSVDRFNEVEFGRKWNVNENTSGDESIQEFSARYRPLSVLSISGVMGRYEREGVFRSRRTEGETAYDDTATVVRYRLEDMKTDDLAAGGISTWLRQQGVVQRTIGFLVPSVKVAAEDRKSQSAGVDSLHAGSFRFLEVSPAIRTEEIARMRGSAEFELRSEDSSALGVMRSSFHSLTQRYSWQLREWESLTSSLSLGIRRTRFSAFARTRGNADSHVLLIRSQARYSPLKRAVETDLYYELSNQRSARLERVFIRVAKGSGNYRYRGDLNANTIAEEEEFEQTRFDGDYVVTLIPGETLYPVVDLKTSARIRLQPARLLNRHASSLNALLSALSSETYARIDERSSDPVSDNISLLRLSRFLNESYTIAGSNLFTQDFYVFENQSDLSFRGRFSQRKGLVQLVSGSEKSYLRERSMRVRSQLVKEIANQTEFVDKLDQVGAAQTSPRERDIQSRNLLSDFSYRPEREWEIGFGFQVGRSEDRFGGKEVSADVNVQLVRVVYAFLGKGQLRSELKREEILLGGAAADPTRILPYELTEGRVVGKTYLWSLAMEYRLTNNVQLTVDYRGRTEGGRPPVHIARAEAKAFF
jgi:hypothetical protein